MPIRINAADSHAAAIKMGSVASGWTGEGSPRRTIAVEAHSLSKRSAAPGQEFGKLENKRCMSMGRC
jgi:hypothetical protein